MNLEVTQGETGLAVIAPATDTFDEKTGCQFHAYRLVFDNGCGAEWPGDWRGRSTREGRESDAADVRDPVLYPDGRFRPRRRRNDCRHSIGLSRNRHRCRRAEARRCRGGNRRVRPSGETGTGPDGWRDAQSSKACRRGPRQLGATGHLRSPAAVKMPVCPAPRPTRGRDWRVYPPKAACRPLGFGQRPLSPGCRPRRGGRRPGKPEGFRCPAG